MNNVLILGGLGFIGFHTALFFKKNNFNVVCIDALKNFFPFNSDQWSYYVKFRESELLKNNVKIIYKDLLTNTIDEEIVTYCPDYIINFVSLPVPSLCEINPNQAKENIFDVNFKILESLKVHKGKFKRYVYISSSLVYGNFKIDDKGETIPPKEEDICSPIDLYGVLKLCSENILRQYSLRYKFEHIIIRPTAVYGPTDSNFRVVDLFVHKALKNDVIILENEGLHKLDFTYIDDCVKGIYLATTNSKYFNQTYNISYGVGRSIYELVLILKEYFPNLQFIKSKHKPLRIFRGALNIEKAKNFLGYSPSFPLEKGINEYISFLKSHYYNYINTNSN